LIVADKSVELSASVMEVWPAPGSEDTRLS
jgi:hypothetical protein